MTTILADMNRSEVYYWLQEHAPRVGCIRDEIEEFLKERAQRLAKCEGVWERSTTTAQSFVETMMDRFDGMLADEVKRDLGL